jgi:hypothetical protein
MRSLFADTKWVVAAIYSSGTASVKAPATGIDTSGYRKVTFIAHLAAIAATAVSSMKIQESDTAVDDAGFTDITSAAAPTIAADDDDQIRIIEVTPRKKYVRLLFTKDATNAVAGSVLACLWNGKESPATQPAGTEGVSIR